MSENIPEICKRQADFCSIFTNPRRLLIMKLLEKGEQSVSAIAGELGFPDHGVSQHLRVMKDRGAVKFRKDGRTVYYRIANKKFLEACRLIREGLMEEHEKMNTILAESE